MTRYTVAGLVFTTLCWLTGPLPATETENVGLQIVPAPGKVVVDGKFDDWDLSAGIFACGDVEHQRTNSAVWIHAMYDADNLYLLARWVDPTPMNNPGSVKGSYGFNGDCLQVRIITAPDTAQERVSHWNCWRDHDGLDAMTAEYGKKFNEGRADGHKEGGAQAFLKDADGKGYVQEIALPWKVLAREGVKPKAGEHIVITIEPNFTITGVGRLTIKDIFRANSAIDRVFTFMSSGCWGYGSLEPKGKLPPRPVRLSDGRELTVSVKNGLPTIDWTGLIKSDEPDGFKTIKFTMPDDGFVSLNLYAPDGTVARQLLNQAFRTKGPHEVKWDGLHTPSVHRPAKPVEPGEYRWAGIFHTGIGLRLRGWAANSGSMPWEGPEGKGGWGGDHGNPVAAACDGERVYLGWASGEGGKPLVAVDLDGHVQWKNIRGGIAGASLIASDGQTVYAFNGQSRYAAVAIYRLDAKSGRYTQWSDIANTDLTAKQILGDAAADAKDPSGIAAAGGKVFVSFSAISKVAVVDAQTGKTIKQLDVARPSGLFTRDGKRLDVLSEAKGVVSIDVETGESKPLCTVELKDKEWASSLAEDEAGNLYLGLRDGRNQVVVYSRDGKLLRSIGREGGRPLTGPWVQEALLTPSDLTIDAKGKLWVAEDDGSPRRISVWDAASGKFLKEYFGSTSYGAGGGAVNPLDPDLMVGQGCEWRLDPKTGQAACLGGITRVMATSRFGFGKDGRLYLAVAPDAIHGINPVRIFERLGDANYKLRTIIRAAGKTGIEVWSDENDDGIEQPEEVHKFDMDLGGWITGWYMPMSPDMTFYGSTYRVPVTGWTACGAPQYDFAKAVKMPAPTDVKSRGGMGAQKGHGTTGGGFMLYNGIYGSTHATFDCYDLTSGKLAWTYPNNFVGVHGSHLACGPEAGMIRGAFDIAGVIRLPDPVGNAWVIPTNKGEWHILTEKGFYVTRLFEGDPMKWQYPEKALPGAVMDSCPPGAGEEAFGGEVTQMKDGRVFLQTGHTAFWNVEVVGLETIKPLADPGSVTVTADDVKIGQSFYDRQLQESVGIKQYTAHKLTPTFTGDIAKDFGGAANLLAYQKQPAAAVRSAIAWDDTNLYVAWEVKDNTPWVNAADAPEFMYTSGDTVDLQFATDPTADRNRKEAQAGDVRISIGNFQGKPTAIAYRRVAAEKHPKVFSSGVVKAYPMDSVVVLDQVKTQVKVDKGVYVVEVVIPLAALDLKASEGMKLRGDMGVTHGGSDKSRTVLRTYWSNQVTGIVSDAVYELQMQPQNWGEVLLGR